LAYVRRASAIGLAPLRISGSLIVLSGACWALVLHHAISMGGEMGVEVIGAEFTLGGLGVFLAVWTVMMGAMMLPSAAPMILTFAAAQARHDRNVVVPTWIFVAAYIFVWAFAGLVGYVLLHAGKDLVKSDAWAPLALGVTLTLAGLYQFTPLKRLCLRRCRSPLVFLKQHWRDGSEDAAEMGCDRRAQQLSGVRRQGGNHDDPIVFVVPEDPVRLGLVASLARPGGNLTGINLFSGELTAKRLEFLREMVPGAARIAVLVNPANATTTETTLRDVQPADTSRPRTILLGARTF
jgi:hypothetical protein